MKKTLLNSAILLGLAGIVSGSHASTVDPFIAARTANQNDKTLTKHINKLKEQVKKLQLKIEGQNTDLKNLRNENLNLQTALAFETSKTAELQNQIRALTAKNDELQREVDNFVNSEDTKKATHYREAFEMEVRKNLALQNELDNFKGLTAALRGENEDLEKKNQKLKRIIDNIKDFTKQSSAASAFQKLPASDKASVNRVATQMMDLLVKKAKENKPSGK